MAIYTFYLCGGDGRSATFEAFELGGDESAPARALKMLAEHRSCAYVAVWSEERMVLVSPREAPDMGDDTNAAGACVTHPQAAK